MFVVAVAWVDVWHVYRFDWESCRAACKTVHHPIWCSIQACIHQWRPSMCQRVLLLFDIWEQVDLSSKSLLSAFLFYLPIYTVCTKGETWSVFSAVVGHHSSIHEPDDCLAFLGIEILQTNHELIFSLFSPSAVPQILSEVQCRLMVRFWINYGFVAWLYASLHLMLFWIIRRSNCSCHLPGFECHHDSHIYTILTSIVWSDLSVSSPFMFLPPPCYALSLVFGAEVLCHHCHHLPLSLLSSLMLFMWLPRCWSD